MREGRARHTDSEGHHMPGSRGNRDPVDRVHYRRSISDQRIPAISFGAHGGSSNDSRSRVPSAEQQRLWRVKYARWSLPIYSTVAVAVLLTVFLVNMYRG